MRNVLVLALSAITLSSCLLDDEKTEFGNGPDFVGFSNSSSVTAFEVSGEIKSYNLPVQYFGPSSSKNTADIVVSVDIDLENTTGEAGVHYDFEPVTITLTAEDGYIGYVPVTILTENAEAPDEVTLAFTLTDVQTESTLDMVVSEKQESTKLFVTYVCPIDISGTYAFDNSSCDPQDAPHYANATITKVGDGTFELSTADGGLLQFCSSNTSLVNTGTIMISCGEVLANNSFGFCGSNGIGCITGGSYDEATQTLTLEHFDEFFGIGAYTSTYVLQ